MEGVPYLCVIIDRALFLLHTSNVVMVERVVCTFFFA